MAELIDRLEGWLNEPYRQDRVYAAVKALGFPCILREIATEAGLPIHITHRCLVRLTKQGKLYRAQTRMTYDQWRARGRVVAPGGMQRRVYLYSIPSEAGAE